MNKIIYAIEIRKFSIGDLSVINVKIGQTANIYSTLHQYKRSNPEAKILDVWEINPSKSVKDCERGVHKIAEKYAHERKRETFIFLQNAYDNFRENVNLLLRNINHKIGGIKRKGKKIRKTNKRIDYTGKSPEMIIFHGKKYKVKTWREILCKIAEEIYKEKGDLNSALKIKGRKRQYFSKNNKDLVDPQKIEGTSYFCEGNLSANDIVRITRKLLDTFGYNQNDLEIVYK